MVNSYTTMKIRSSFPVALYITHFSSIYPLVWCLLLLSGKEISSIQYTLECNRVLHFEVGQSEVCHSYTITNDETCELGVNATQFKLRLSLSSTDRLRINSSLSETMVTIDDSQEPECCKYSSYIQPVCLCLLYRCGSSVPKNQLHTFASI